MTIGTRLYEFDMTGVPGQCRNTGTAIVGSFNVDTEGRPLPVTETGALLQINFDIPAPNPSDPAAVPPRIFVVDTTQAQMWLAGADASEGLQPEHSVVTTWTLVDGVARGTAAFAEINSYGASPKATQGTFEIVCPS